MRTRGLFSLGMAWALLVALCWWGIATAHAEAPHAILHQGRPTDNSGMPINATLAMTFAL
jgi:hypothetical protein